MEDDLNGISTEWALIDGQGLVRVIHVDSFRIGVVLVLRLGELAEAMNHDPDVHISHQKVTITLISHDVGEVTKRDYIFAKSVDDMVASK